MKLKPKRFEIEPDIFVSDSGHAWSAKNNPELAKDCEAFYSEKTIKKLIEQNRALEGSLDICRRYAQGEYRDPSSLAADYGGLGYEKHPAVISVGNLCSEVDRLKKPLLKRIAELELKIEAAFREGYWARSTYNDMEASDEDEEWAKFVKSNGINEDKTC